MGPSDFRAPPYPFGMARALPVVTIDFTLAAWNTVANHRALTVTGLCLISHIWRVKTQAVGGAGATMQVGYTTSTNAIMTAQLLTALGPNLILNIAATAPANPKRPDSAFMSAASAVQFCALYDGDIAGGRNIGYNIAVNPATDGIIEVYAFWTPVSSNGNVAAGTGGAL